MVRLTEIGEDLKEASEERSLLGVFTEFLRLSDERNRSDDSDSGPQPLPIYRFPAVAESGIARGFAEVERPMRMSALEEVVNNDSIVLNAEMVKQINDPMVKMLPTGEMTKLLEKPKRKRTRRKKSEPSGLDIIRRSGQFDLQNILPDLPKKKKRKTSNYQKEFGKQLKMLKKKHPRTKISNLMGKAHRATRKSLKK